VGTSPIHKDQGCRAPNERCDNLSGPVVRKSSIRENVAFRTFRARYLENGAPEAFRVNERPIESRGRPIERRRELRPRTSPKGRNALPGPRRKRKSAEKSPRIDGESARGVARRRESRRDGAANDRHRNAGAGGPAGPPARKNSKFRAAQTAVKDRNYRHARRSSQWTPKGPPPATTNGEPTANRGGASPKGRDRLRPPPTPQKGPTGDRPSSARGADRQKRKFSTPRTKPFRSSEARQTWQKRPHPRYDPKSEDCETKSPSVPELGEVENLGAPSLTRKPKVGSTSDRCQTKGPYRGSELPKFEADRTDGFRDTGVRKFTPS
jgi:hypothetical protein